MLATFHWTRKGAVEPALRIADRLQGDQHDLIQKAVGWMVREVGKRDPQRFDAFLAERYRHMPRTPAPSSPTRASFSSSTCCCPSS